MSNALNILEYIDNNDLTSLKNSNLDYNRITFDEFIIYALDNKSPNEIITLLINNYKGRINIEILIYALKTLNLTILNVHKDKIGISYKFDDKFSKVIMTELLKKLYHEDEEIIDKIINSNFIKMTRKHLYKYIVRNFIPEYLKIFELLLNIKVGYRNLYIKMLTINEIRHINNKDYKKQFCDFCIRYMKNETCLLEYILIVNDEISTDILKEIEFTFNTRKLENISKYKISITNIDILVYLSQDDNFYEFVKINRDELIELCDEKCGDYIKTFI